MRQKALDPNWQRRRELHELSGRRMQERQSRGVQREPFHRDRQRRTTAPPVHAIARHRVAEVGQVDPDLVGPAGLQARLQISEVGEALEDPPPRHRPPSPAHGPNGHPGAVVRVSPDRLIHDALGAGDAAVDHRVIDAPHGPGEELRGERFVGGGRLGDDQESGRVLVQTVHDARPARSTDARRAGRMRQHRGGERASRMPGPGMNDHPGWLVEHQHVLVLVHDRERDGLGLERLRRERRDLDLDPLAGGHVVGGLALRPVHANQSRVDQRLESGARHTGQLRGQPAVQTLAGGLRRDDQRPTIVRDIYRSLLGATDQPGFALGDTEAVGMYSIDEVLGDIATYRLWQSANRCGAPGCLQH